MGKSSASCLKIIACGSDSVDHDDVQTPEGKGSSDRRGWSFRKRSARHRVLSNSVISGSPSSANKENPDSTPVNFQVQPDLTVPEKTSVIQPELKVPEKASVIQPELNVPEKSSVIQPDLTLPEKTSVIQPDLTLPEKTSVIQPTEEKPELSVQAESKLSDIIAVREDECKADAILDVHSIIIIQAAIRRLLAQQVLLKQQNVIKLQAAVRGHLVRRHAVGTLRCVQAIVKMQALVRARRARLHVNGPDDSTLQSTKKTKSNGTYTYISIEKLLGNAFARQLMESTPRTRSINIKCEPLKSDSAWNWLERWMSVSTVSKQEPQESESDEEQHEESLGSDLEQHKESLREHSDGNEDILAPSDCHAESPEVKSGLDVSAEASENVNNLMIFEESNLDHHSSKPISPLPCHSEPHDIDSSNSISDKIQSALIEIKEPDLIEKVEEVTSLPEKDETGNERDVPYVKNAPTELPETEVKSLSRKASNPAFIAAQSKFEEMSSATTSAKSNTSSSHEPEVESSFNKAVSSTDEPFMSRDIGLADNATSNECGTELSISSTLDSLNRSYAEVNNIEQDTDVPDDIDHTRVEENSELEANEKSIIHETDPSYTNTNKFEREESINSATQESLITAAADSPQLEKTPEADTPRSHKTLSESQATPSSQVSVKHKKRKSEKTDSNRKKSSSAEKKSVPKGNQDSSLEQLQEHKAGKRRNSFGSTKPDQREQEARDSSSSNSLPSYMQATESARAKAIANGSPRSSPDVNEKEIYIKKRQSLPGVNERQGSPRIQRSLSQAQPNAKGSGTNSPQDRKWRR